ncbi:MAG TPA: hypothetical protein VII61_22730 [Ktedonobacteraceae bacterium]
MLVTYTIYDDLGRPTDQSLPYAIANPSNAYVTPDRNQARTDECNLRWIAAENGLQR